MQALIFSDLHQSRSVFSDASILHYETSPELLTFLGSPVVAVALAMAYGHDREFVVLVDYALAIIPVPCHERRVVPVGHDSTSTQQVKPMAQKKASVLRTDANLLVFIYANFLPVMNSTQPRVFLIPQYERSCWSCSPCRFQSLSHSLPSQDW